MSGPLDLLPLRRLDDDRVAQVLRRDLVHPLRRGGGEERRLPFARRLREDALDVRREAAVEHLVGLVEHEVGDAVEAHRAAVQVVEHASRRADDDLRAAVDRVLLRAEGPAAVDQRRADAGALAELSSTPPTCCASSRVGTSTSAWSHLLSRLIRSMSGSPNASVLPEPVKAWPMTSLPSSRGGIDGGLDLGRGFDLHRVERLHAGRPKRI